MNSVSSSPMVRGTCSLGVALLVGAVAACSAGVDEAAVLDDDTRARIVAAASPAASHLAGTLSGELMAAVREGGPAHAIGFCANEALELTGGVAAELGEGWQVKRTSRRLRNPANAPDELEADALDIAPSGSPPCAWNATARGTPCSSPCSRPSTRATRTTGPRATRKASCAG